MLLAAGIIELGPSDNIALDQPRVAIELAKDVDPGPGVRWESIGPDLFNTFLLDTGASSVLAMATAIADMEQSRLGYDVQGSLLEQGVAGDHLLDVSVPYRFDFAGSDGTRHTIADARIMSDANNDFSSFGPWGLAGMPAMVNRVTSLDFTGWSGGGLGLDDIYMDTEFRNDVPPSNGHRYTVSLDNRLAFDPLEQMISGQPPIWGDVPFVTGIPEHNGIAQEGNFLFDTGAQISVISERLAIEIGLDSNGDGTLDQNDTNYVTSQVVGGVGGQIAVPVFGFDEFHLTTDSGEDLVWTNLEWLVLDIATPGEGTSLDGVLGSDLLTSGWFHAFFSPGQPDGYINQLHMDFRDMETTGTSKVHFDLNPDVDNVILPGPGIIVRQSFRTTDVGEGGETDSYNVVLTGAPTADVIITLDSPDGQATAENAIDGSSTLVFTPDNWETVQTVLVTAVDDVAAEGNHSGLITHTVTSADSGYEGRAVADVTVRITDDDLNLLKLSSDQAGLQLITSIDAVEAGATVYYWAALNERPINETWVVLEDSKLQAEAVKASNAQLGLENVLMFNSSNWDTPQRVALTALDDAIKEGPHQSNMIHTVLDVINFSDPIVGQTPLTVNITDDDLGHVTIKSSDGSTEISEDGTTDTYQIALDRLPTADVVITVQAGPQVLLSIDGGTTFVSTQQLTFSDTLSQTVTVKANDDSEVEDTHFGNITHTVSGTANDPRFPLDLSIGSLMATIADNDVAGLSIDTSTASGRAGKSPTTGSSINLAEASGSEVYAVWLNSKPQADVTVFLSNTDQQVVAVDAQQGTHHFLTFTPDNWNQPQEVSVSAVNDAVVEGVHRSQIAHNTLSGDLNYHGSVVLPVVVTDNDVAEFGDAPLPYPTTIADNGASHVPVGPQLGANRDSELDGIPSPGANGDDNGGTSDEDGVQFGGIPLASNQAAVNILLQNAATAKVDAWIDFDRDGVWAASEKILDSVTVSNAMQTLNYDLPANVEAGEAFARVRLSSTGNLDPTGPAIDGEVEDYLVKIVSPPLVESVVINHGDPQRSSINAVTVNFDRVVDIDSLAGDPFRIFNTATNEVVNDVAVLDHTSGKTVVELTFAEGPSASSFGSLLDGNYRLSIDASLVTYLDVPLDGDGNGSPGGDHLFGDNATDAFFRKFSDANGNGIVDLLDFADFRRTFGLTTGQTGYASEFDSDGDQAIGLLDFAAFRRSFGR